MLGYNWKTPFIDKSLLKRLKPKHEKKPAWSSRSTIYPAAVGLKLRNYNDRQMVDRKIKPEMVGHTIGTWLWRVHHEYAPPPTSPPPLPFPGIGGLGETPRAGWGRIVFSKMSAECCIVGTPCEGTTPYR